MIATRFRSPWVAAAASFARVVVLPTPVGPASATVVQRPGRIVMVRVVRSVRSRRASARVAGSAWGAGAGVGAPAVNKEDLTGTAAGAASPLGAVTACGAGCG